MKTSYFSKSGSHPNAVSIAGKSPDWYYGTEYKVLAPKWWFYANYKNSDQTEEDEQAYIDAYKEEVLGKLDPHEVHKLLGDDAVLLCWESSEKFCHRHIVAEWFKAHGIEIEEIEC